MMLDFGIRPFKSFPIIPRYEDLEAYFKSGRKILIYDVGLDDSIFTEIIKPIEANITPKNK